MADIFEYKQDKIIKTPVAYELTYLDVFSSQSCEAKLSPSDLDLSLSAS